ncbi:MAG: transposase [Bacillota bacterium]
MSRLPRTHVDEAFYHVLARGNNKQDIFLQESDYYLYLYLLDEYATRSSVTVHAHALLPNHIHLLLQVDTIPVSSLMHVLQQTYTQAFNRKHERVGHLFQGRYKAILVEDDAYLLSLVKYIHMNPVEAGFCSDPSGYLWSSHRHYMYGRGAGKVDTTFVKSVMAEFGGQDIDGYVLLPYKPLRANTDSLRFGSVSPIQTQASPTLDQLLEAVCAVNDLTPSAITGSSKERAIVRTRRLFMYYSVYLAGHRMVDVASYLGKSNGIITIATNSVKEALREKHGEWEASIRSVEQELASKNLK